MSDSSRNALSTSGTGKPQRAWVALAAALLTVVLAGDAGAEARLEELELDGIGHVFPGTQVSRDGSVIAGVALGRGGCVLFRWQDGAPSTTTTTQLPYDPYRNCPHHSSSGNMSQLIVDLSADGSTVVGTALTPEEWGPWQPVMWNETRLNFLDDPDKRFAGARGVSGDGSVVVGGGYFGEGVYGPFGVPSVSCPSEGFPESCGFYWLEPQGVVWRHGAPTLLVDLPGMEPYRELAVYGIDVSSDGGTIVATTRPSYFHGYAYFHAGLDTYDFDNAYRAVIWQDGVASEIGAADGCHTSWATQVSASGRVMLASGSGDCGSIDGQLVYQHALRWEAGSVENLGTLSETRIRELLSIEDERVPVQQNYLPLDGTADGAIVIGRFTLRPRTQDLDDVRGGFVWDRTSPPHARIASMTTATALRITLRTRAARLRMTPTNTIGATSRSTSFPEARAIG